METKPTGNLRWEWSGHWWGLQQELEVSLVANYKYWMSTEWWIMRHHPECWEVRGHPSGKVIQKFWSLKEAKAYAEVCHRMGVKP